MKSLLVIWFLFLCTSSFAQKKNMMPDAVKSPVTEEEKHPNNILNPPPTEKLRELISERPDITEGPITVDPGHFIFELSLATFNRGEYETIKTGEKVETMTYGATKIRTGILHDLELQLIVPGYQEVSDGTKRKKLPGTEDLIFRTKLNIFGNDGGPLATGIIAYAGSGVLDEKAGFIPTGTEMFGGLPPGSGVLGTMFVALSDNWKLGSMVGAHYSAKDYVLTSIALSTSLSERFVGVVEVFNAGEVSSGNSSKSLFANGLIYSLDEDVKIDMGTIFGLTPSASDFQITSGLVFRI